MATTKPRAKLNFDLDDKAAPIMAITTTEIRKTVATRLPLNYIAKPRRAPRLKVSAYKR